MLLPATLKFLKDLKKNNHKPWFDAHRPQYEAAKENFASFIQTIIDKHSLQDPTIKEQTAKGSMFRINRDVRFSKDKRPYKSNFGASINRGGKKSIYAGYYFHLEPGDSFVGGGVWMPQPAETKKVRQEIDYCLDEFKGIVNHKKFKSIYGELYTGEDVTLSRVPQGFDKDNPAGEFLKFKSWLAIAKLKDSDLTDGSLVKNTLAAFEALQPMVVFINRALDE